MKLLYLFLMFSTSSIIGIYYSYLMYEREKTLIALNNFFKYLLIQIASKRCSLEQCIQNYNAEKELSGFLTVLAEKIREGYSDPFGFSVKYLYALSKNDVSYIKFINIGRLDRNGQIKVLENAIAYIDEEIKTSYREEKKRNAVSYSGILAGVALVIIFV